MGLKKDVVGKRRVGDMHGERRPVLTKLETRSPRYPELDRNSHQGRVEVYYLVEEGGKDKSKIRQKRTANRARTFYERERVGYTHLVYRQNSYLLAL